MSNNFTIFTTICSICRHQCVCPVPIGDIVEIKKFDCHNCKAYLGEFSKTDRLE